MTETNPFESMMKMGQEWAKQMAPAMESFTPKGFEELFPTVSKEMMEQFMGKGISPDGLDAKTRLLLTLQGLTIHGAQAEAQIRLTVTHLVESGASKQEIAETIGLAALFGGVPAMTKAMEVANSVLEKDGSE